MLIDQVKKMLTNLHELLAQFAEINMQQQPDKYEYYIKISTRNLEWLLKTAVRKSSNLYYYQLNSWC